MTTTEIDRIVLLTPAEYGAELARLEAREEAAYAAYCGGTAVPASPPGTAGAAGLGSWACDLNAGGVQDAWVAARRAVEALRDARESAQRWALRHSDRARLGHDSLRKGCRLTLPPF